MGEDCPCPADIQEELYDFHNQLQLHCGELQISQNHVYHETCIIIFNLWQLSYIA